VKTLGEKFTLPLVVRLQGTNDDLGKKILRDSGLKIHPVADLDEAGRKACELAAK
jgi:succinyl-CoA synthetase beta subunit